MEWHVDWEKYVDKAACGVKTIYSLLNIQVGVKGPPCSVPSLCGYINEIH